MKILTKKNKTMATKTTKDFEMIISEMDESGANGLWDYSAEIARQIAYERKESEPIYAEEWGQEIIYNAFRALLEHIKQ